MKLVEALVASIMLVNPNLNSTQAEGYSRQLISQASENNLDPWLMEALITKESRWISTAIRREGDGSCSVGLGQINLKSCDPVKVAELEGPLENIRRTARHLAIIRDLCPKVRPKKKCSQLAWIGLYNPGSRTYAKSVLLLMKEHRVRHPVD